MPQFLRTMLQYSLILFIAGMVVNFFISWVKEIVMERTYVDLHKFISFEGFNYDNYYVDEREILQPQLEELGFSEFEWSMGEADSFGPLTRVCKAKTSNDQIVHFVYG
jgi:hypothetical protein